MKKFGDISNIDINPAISDATIMVQRAAKDFAPVDTGMLMNSIHRRMDKGQSTGIVYTTTEYGVYQEFGTRKMAAHPFMLPAINQNRAGINVLLSSYIRKRLSEATKN